MARIVSVGTAVPPYVLDAAAFEAALARAFAAHFADLRPLLRMAQRCGVRRRFVSLPVDALLEPRPLSASSRLYRDCVVPLAERAAREALRRAELPAAAIDLVVAVSCTGYLLPSLDAYLVASLGLRSDVRRLPISTLGCLAGAAALARTAELMHGSGASTALVVAAETPSLTFQPADGSMDNLVSSLVFADGAGAAVLRTDEGPGIAIESCASRFVPGTLDDMGFDLRDGGLHVVLSKDVPALLAPPFAEAVAGLLAEAGLGLRDLGFAVVHPGGPKVLQAVDGALGIEGLTAPSWRVLERYGNQSSAAVLFVLAQLLEESPPADGAWGLLAGFGPGLSLELALLRQRA